MPVNWWFPDPDDAKVAEMVERAKSVCAGCPVLAPCRRWALAHPAERGVWGGLTEGERRRVEPDEGSGVMDHPQTTAAESVA